MNDLLEFILLTCLKQHFLKYNKKTTEKGVGYCASINTIIPSNHYQCSTGSNCNAITSCWNVFLQKSMSCNYLLTRACQVSPFFKSILNIRQQLFFRDPT
jgi:hypothetical protein